MGRWLIFFWNDFRLGLYLFRWFSFAPRLWVISWINDDSISSNAIIKKGFHIGCFDEFLSHYKTRFWQGKKNTPSWILPIFIFIALSDNHARWLIFKKKYFCLLISFCWRIFMSNHHLFYTSTWPTIPCLRNCLRHQWIRTRSRGDSHRSVHSGSSNERVSRSALANNCARSQFETSRRNQNGILPRILWSSFFWLADIYIYWNADYIGLGALSAPFVATHFAQQQHWSYHYLISLFFSILNSISFFTIIGFKTQDGKHIFSVARYICRF